MIALPGDLPCVELEDGRLVGFERGWLAESLCDAARQAGYPGWWLAEHVAASVTQYLKTHYAAASVSLPRLRLAVESILEVIGYPEVARQFNPGRPPVRISLEELARAAGDGYELAFFRLLARRIDEVMSERVSRVELFGLERCVKQLRAKKAWGRRCDALRAEIVTFVRARMGVRRPAKNMAVSLS